MKDAKALTITYLTKASYTSLNGSDKEADNISSIKKIQMGGLEYPYCSSQAVRRALREQLAVLGHTLSEGVAAIQKKVQLLLSVIPSNILMMTYLVL